MTVLARVAELGATVFRSTRMLNQDLAGQPFVNATGYYRLLEAYYANEPYDEYNSAIERAKARYGLYRNTRSIRNPMRRAVDWYPGHVYPGAMTPDGLALPDGTPSCVPFAQDVDPAVRLAMNQALQWGNWAMQRWSVVRDMAMLGDTFAEVYVDYEREKVYPVWYHPAIVQDITWNNSGDVVGYEIEIKMMDERQREQYRWGKRVTKEKIVTLRNGKPYGYDDQPAEVENPWGFCPAVWAQFRNVGGQHGASVIDGVRPKIDELNSALSSIMDYIGKFANQGSIIVTKSGAKSLEVANLGRSGQGSTGDLDNPQALRQKVQYIVAPEGTTILRLLENLGLEEAQAYIDGLVGEIEADLPEATLDDKVREHPDVAGVALRMMFGDVTNRLTEVQGNADAMLIKLIQMAVSIGGQLLQDGDWGQAGPLSEAQLRFGPFDLGSYDRGELGVTLVPRPLFPESASERIQRAAAIEALRTPTAMRIAGLDDATIAALTADQESAAGSTASLLGRAFAAGSA